MTHVAYLCADPGVPVFGTKGSSVHVQEIVRAWARDRRRSHGLLHPARHRAAQRSCRSRRRRSQAGIRPGPARERAVQDAALGLADEVLRNGCGLFYERYSMFSPALSVVARILDVPSVLEVNAPLIEEQQRYRQLLDVKKAETVFPPQRGHGRRRWPASRIPWCTGCGRGCPRPEPCWQRTA